MNKILTKKLFILVLLFITSFFIFSKKEVKAVEIAPDQVTDEMIKQLEKMEKSVSKEEKIMKYDSRTKQTTEVNMQEIKQLSKLRNSNSNTTNEYNPIRVNTNLETIQPRAVFNRVYDVTADPNFHTGLITISGNNAGTGFLVGRNLVLTAAHCVMDDNNQFYDWRFYPAYAGGAYEGYSSGWAEVYYSNNWTSSHSPDYDWCLCILYEDLGSRFGWYACQTYSNNSDFDGRSVGDIGYPGAFEDGHYQYYTYGTVSNTHDRYFDSTSQVISGFSGGPIYQTSNKYVIGLNKGYYTSRPHITFGVKITHDIVDLINSFI